MEYIYHRDISLSEIEHTGVSHVAVYLCRKDDATNLCLTFPMLAPEIGMHFVVYFTTLSVSQATQCVMFEWLINND